VYGSSNPSPAPLATPELEPAPSPGEAIERSLRAQAEGDEAAYRRVVVFRPPGGYMDVSLRAQFAGARLHRAVRECGVTGKRVADARSTADAAANAHALEGRNDRVLGR